MRILLPTLCLLLFVLPLKAQKIDHLVSFRNIDSERYFRFNYDNDYFAASDRDYTQGYSLEYVHPALVKNPLNFLFFLRKEEDARYGLAVEHIGFTPDNYESEEIQFGDRPFAAAIMLKSFRIDVSSENRSRWSQAVSIGLIGPGAFGEEMQVEIHRITDNDIPKGWKHQIKNDIVLNYRIDYEKQLLKYNDIFALQAGTSAQVGTLFTKASLNLNSQIGLINAPFKSDKKRNFQLYFYAQPELTAVGYDATLQGGLFNRKSVYTIDSRDVEPYTAQFNYGLILKTKTLYFEYSRTTMTKEFATGRAAKWGGIRVGFTF